ncbi:MAG TPA: hypothetical protein VN643_16930 [Pyrinomonadaceae bacterium]|nr:hypothetical protein [Pyrinomonadaceae bacterium]
MKYDKRQRRIAIVRERLVRRSWPRLLVTLIIVLTGLAGFLTSASLLHLGVLQMAVRYPVAIGVGYFAFLTLLALWLWLQRHSFPDFFDSCSDVAIEVMSRTRGPSLDVTSDFGGGGNFRGGGAGGGFVDSGSAAVHVDSGGSIADIIPFDIDLEELGCLIIAGLALLAGLFSTFYVIYIAPSLLAEILVDGALVAGLYRRVRRIEDRHWLQAAIKRTVFPAMLVALFLTVAGYAMQKAIPEAHTMGEVWRHIFN